WRDGIGAERIEPRQRDRRFDLLLELEPLEAHEVAVPEFGAMVDDRQRRRAHLTVARGSAVLRVDIDRALPDQPRRHILYLHLCGAMVLARIVGPIFDETPEIQLLSLRVALAGREIVRDRLRPRQDRLRSMEMTLPIFGFDLGCNLRRDFFVSCASRPAESIAGSEGPFIVPNAVTLDELEGHRFASMIACTSS